MDPTKIFLTSQSVGITNSRERSSEMQQPGNEEDFAQIDSNRDYEKIWKQEWKNFWKTKNLCRK